MSYRPSSGPARVASSRRGQPLLVLGIVLGSWIFARALLWEPPFARDGNFALEAGFPVVTQEAAEAAVTGNSPVRLQSPLGPDGFADPAEWQAPALEPILPRTQIGVLPQTDCCNAADPLQDEESGALSSAQQAAMPTRMVAGHTMLMAAGFSQMEVPEHLLRYFMAPEQPAAVAAPSTVPDGVPYLDPPAAHSAAAPRWSIDGWAMWRDDTSSPLLSGRPAYGRSQIGAVLRYELAPTSGHRPQGHLRGTAALAGSSEMEVAAGLSARPLTDVPVRVAAEARLSERANGTEIRPAAYAVTELPPLALPGGLQAELYLQGGYVGGDFATAFVDGQARIDRELADVGDFSLRAGGAVWGGAQEDAARIDIGPSAAMSFDLGDGRGRLSADYRVRIAGDARPASGPALTLSAGF